MNSLIKRILFSISLMMPLYVFADEACEIQESVCVEPFQTRIINGMSITRDCWKYKTTYVCAPQSDTVNECTELRAKGCTQTGSVLEAENLYRQTYSCTTQGQLLRTYQDCGGQTLCTDGKCFEGDATANTAAQNSSDFSKAAVSIAIWKEAETDGTTDPLLVFSGAGDSCRRNLAGITNCCKNPKDFLLAAFLSCSDDEKELARRRKSGMCIELGTYCSKKLLGKWCTQETTGLCCYNSKMSRIINQQGWPQLGRGFGSAQGPVCTGFSPEQLQQLDFGAMDLSELYEDIKTTMPSAEDLKAKAQAGLQNQETNGYY